MSKPSGADLKDVEYRSLPLVVALSAATLFIGYPIYLCYVWAREMNGLDVRKRHSPQVVLILSLATLGVGSLIYECIFAHDLERYFRERGRTDGMPQLSMWVVVLNVLTVVFSLTGVGLLLAIPCGMAATCLLQAEFNKLAQRAHAMA
jgi:hypothetical protein